MNQKLGGAAVGYASIALGVVANLAALPVILRILGQQEYGIYSMVYAAASFLTLLGAGFNAAYLRFFWHTKSRGGGEAGVNRVFLTILGGVALLIVTVGVILTPVLPQMLGGQLGQEQAKLARSLWLVMCATVALSLPITLFDSYLLAKDRIVRHKLVVMARQVVAPVAFVPVLLLGAGSLGMAIVTLVLYILTGLWVIFYCLQELGFSAAGVFDKDLAVGVVGFSSFLLLNTVIDQVNWTADRIILGWTSDVSEVAVYSLGAQINSYFMMLSVSLLMVFAPAIHEYVANGKERELQTRVDQVSRLQALTLGLVLVTFILWGAPLMSSWAGQEYARSFNVAVVLMVAGFVPFVQNVAIEVQKARNLHQFRTVSLAVSAVINILVSVALSQRWGSIGAALGTALVILLVNGLVIGVYSQRRVGVDLQAAWAVVLRTCGPTVLVSGLVAALLHRVLPQTLAATLIGVSVTTFVYISASWTWGLTSGERSAARSVLVRGPS